MNTRKGFSLVELLAVIAIIGILTAIIYPSLSGVRAKARDSRRSSDISQIQLGLATYLSKHNAYPSALADLVTDGYFTVLPADPKGGSGYDYSTDGTSYCLGATMETSRYIMPAPPCSAGSANYTVKK